jgi:ABC-2 type transport system permease protein
VTTTAARPRPAVAATVPTGRAEAAIARRAFRQLWLGASLCAIAFGGSAAASALSYASTFTTVASRHQLVATTSSDRGLAVLLGPVASVGTVGGYTVYKGFVFLTTIGAVWAILVTTRLLRGEEDTGRWQMVLAGRTRPGRATAATLMALFAGAAVIWFGTTLLTWLAGRDSKVGFGAADSAVYALSIVVPVLALVAVAAVSSQLCRVRRAATGLAIAVFGALFVLRMIGDSGTGTRWVLWATPFGWAERMEPITANDLAPLVPAVLFTVALAGVALWLAARRDVGDGVLATRTVAPPKHFGLGSTLGLSARLELPVLVAWGVGAAVTGLLLGVIGELTTAQIPQSLRDTLDQFGVKGGFSAQYFGVAFLLVAAVVALLPAGQVGAAAAEETSGRLVPILVQPARRTAWFAGRLALATAAVVVAGLFAGLGAWAGGASQGLDLRLGTMVGAGLNVVPTALVVLGIGALVLAVAPRAASPVVYAIVGWSLIVDLVASMVSGMAWAHRLALFHYMALAPAQDVSVTTVVATVLVAVALGLLAIVVFARRDLQTA